jgi:hypothetical protein
MKLQKTRGQQLLPLLVASGRPEKFDLRCQRLRARVHNPTLGSPASLICVVESGNEKM